MRPRNALLSAALSAALACAALPTKAETPADPPTVPTAAPSAEARYLAELAALPADDGIRILGYIAYHRLAALRMAGLVCQEPGWARGDGAAAEGLQVLASDGNVALAEVAQVFFRVDRDTPGLGWAMRRLVSVADGASALRTATATALLSRGNTQDLEALHAATTAHLDDVMLFARQMAGLGWPTTAPNLPEFVAAAGAFERALTIDEDALMSCLSLLADEAGS
ncbi:MAG: hypothetical protein AAF899_19665 [Pseudomonadota bacterium]